MAWWKAQWRDAPFKRLEIEGILDLDDLLKAFLRIKEIAMSPRARDR